MANAKSNSEDNWVCILQNSEYHLKLSLIIILYYFFLDKNDMVFTVHMTY